MRAAEIGASTILVAKKGVDGVYSEDPKINPDATKFDELTYSDILRLNLKILDTTATSLCMDNNIPLLVFGIDDTENITRALKGEKIGTIVRRKDD